MNLRNLGQKIQIAREEKRMTQEQLANAIGCSQSALSNYEKGKRRIYLSHLEKLSEVLDKPLEYFVEGFADNAGNDYPTTDANQDSNLIRLINIIYTLRPDERKQVEDFIHFLQWKRQRGG